MAYIAYIITVILIIMLILREGIHRKNIKDLSDVLWQRKSRLDYSSEIAETHSTLEESLINFFDQTIISRAVLLSLAHPEKPVSLEQIRKICNTENPQWKKLPENAYRSTIIILIGAGFISNRQGKYIITEMGKTLARKVKVPQQ